jgi:plastocyanin
MSGRMRRIAIAAFLICLGAVSLRLFWRPAPSGARTRVVTVEGMKFVPAVLELRVGDRVVFQNHDLVPHTATARDGEVFDSGPLPAGQEWSFTPTRAGTTRYACLFHPTMGGSLVVTGP